MYFGSQRAYPFDPEGCQRGRRGGRRRDLRGHRAVPPARGRRAGELGLRARRRQPLAGLPEGGPLRVRATASKAVVRATVVLDRPATVDLVLRSSDLRTERWHSGGPDRPVAVTLAAVREPLGAGRHTVHLPLPRLLRSGVGATLTAVTTLDGEHVASAVPLTL